MASQTLQKFNLFAVSHIFVEEKPKKLAKMDEIRHNWSWQVVLIKCTKLLAKPTKLWDCESWSRTFKFQLFWRSLSFGLEVWIEYRSTRWRSATSLISILANRHRIVNILSNPRIRRCSFWVNSVSQQCLPELLGPGASTWASHRLPSVRG